jgi:hypothetical protein
MKYNKWIKIESEADLPNDICSCWVVMNGNVINMAVLFNHIDKTFTDGKITTNYTLISDYQIIKKPKLPIQ